MVASLKTNIMSLLASVPEIDDREDLGTMLMMEIRSSIAVPPDRLRELWEKHGLPMAHLPRPRTANDAFRRAAPRNRPSKGLMLVEYKGGAKHDEDLELVYVLTRSSDVDDKIFVVHRNRSVIGLKKDGTLYHQPPLNPPTDDERAYIHEIGERFERIRQTVDGDQIRGACNAMLREASAVWVHTSTHVIPQTQVQTARAITGLVRDLDAYIPDNHGANRLVVLQYIDTPDQRDQLREQISSHVEREIQSKFVKIAKARQDRAKMGERAKETMLSDINQLGLLIAEYESVLRESLQPVHNMLALQQHLLRQELDTL